MDALSKLMFPQAAKLVNVSATSAQTSTDWGETSVAVELYATQAMFFRFSSATGTDTTAVGTDYYLGLGERRTYLLGSKKRISAIRSTADGILYITELYDPPNRRTPN
jgi:hypothetical protein